MTILKPIMTYDGLVDALIERRHELGMSCDALEAVSGLQTGYVTKLENWNSTHRGKTYGRNMGPTTLPLWLEGLKVGLILVDAKTGKRVSIGASMKRLSDEEITKILRSKAGAARAQNLSSERRREIARRAAESRWAKQRPKRRPAVRVRGRKDG